MSSNSTEQYLDEMIQLPGVISIGIINASNGLTIAYRSQDPSIDNRLSGSYQAEIVKNVIEGAKYIHGLDGVDVFDRIVINNAEQVHFIASANNNRLISHCIVDPNEINMGILNATHSSHVNKLSI